MALNPQLEHLNEPANASQQPTKQELVHSHHNLNVQIGQWVNDDAFLLATTTKVNFDPNTFRNAPGAMINRQIEALQTMQE